MQRDPMASDRARKAERRADEKSGLITIKPLKGGGSGAGAAGPGVGFKKGGFKSAFGGVDTRVEVEEAKPKAESRNEEPPEPVESETDDDYEYYDPKRPTGCPEDCPGRQISQKPTAG